MAGKKKSREGEESTTGPRRQVSIDADLCGIAIYIAQIRGIEDGRTYYVPDILNPILRRAIKDDYAKAIEMEERQLKARKASIREEPKR